MAFGRILGLINIEGNLCPEDCMFSRRAVAHKLDSFELMFRQMMGELRPSRYAGDQIIAHNMALNIDVRAYHTYSFETVAESDSGRLIEEFLALSIPRLFLYGDANNTLSYLPRLRSSAVQVREIPLSGHFLFYDNPVETFQVVAEFVRTTHCRSVTMKSNVRITILLASEKDARAISTLIRKNANAVLSADYSLQQLAAWKRYNAPARIRQRMAERTAFCAFRAGRLCGTIALQGSELVGSILARTCAAKASGRYCWPILKPSPRRRA